MPWKKGQSGNPNGRPKKVRTLTRILEQAGSKTIIDTDGKRRSGKRIMARLLWEIATTGGCRFPGGDNRLLEADEWFNVVKWIYEHTDGPPQKRIDVTSDDKQLGPGVAGLGGFVALVDELAASKGAQGREPGDVGDAPDTLDTVTGQAVAGGD